MQKAIKEKEFELVTIKNQKLESLCRALQEERKSLYEKVQGAVSGPTEKQESEAQEVQKVQEVQDVQENPQVARDDCPVQTTPAPAKTPAAETPLSKELAKLKSEQALLKEIASSFTISHVVPTETVACQSQGLPEGVKEVEENHAAKSNVESLQEAEGEEGMGEQKQRELEMEAVD